MVGDKFVDLGVPPFYVVCRAGTGSFEVVPDVSLTTFDPLLSHVVGELVNSRMVEISFFKSVEPVVVDVGVSQERKCCYSADDQVDHGIFFKGSLQSMKESYYNAAKY